ncbi:MAG: alpha/beta hydrolase [Acidobacteriota bacterium]
MRHLILLAALTATPLFAQHLVQVPRSDGHQTPLMVYEPTASATCAPLAVISHGAGGSELGLSYLGHFLSQHGFLAVVMGHAESGRRALLADIASQHGTRPGIQYLVADPTAEGDRLLDVSAALTWANQSCKHPFRILLGHSMGAETVTLEAGARNQIGIPSTLAGLDRFDAYVALSPQGPGSVYAEHAWASIHKPILMLTGTLDESLNGGPSDRQVPWHELPGQPSHCQWLGVIDGATHANMGGNGPGHEKAEPYITSTIEAFLTGVHANACKLPLPQTGFTLQAK